MTTAATARSRSPRRSQSRARTVRQATLAVPPSIQEALARQEIALRHQEYEVLGRLETVILDQARRMEFLKEGPTLAFAAGDLLVLNDWQGLPPLRSLSNDLCPACQAPCDECDGKGKRACQLTGCGGRGRVFVAGRKPKDLPVCGRCQGTGKAPCDLCRGSGSMATGKQLPAGQGWDELTSEARNALPDCSSCGGMRRAAQVTPQTFAPFALGRMGGLIALGPIQCLVLRRPGRREEGGGIQVMKMLPDHDGNCALLLVEPSAASSDGSPGSRAWLVGGRPQFTDVGPSARYRDPAGGRFAR